MSPMVTILICVIVLVVIGTGFALYLAHESKRKKRMLNVIMGHSAKADPRKSAADEQHKRRAEIAKKLKEGDGDEEAAQKKKKATIATLLGQAGFRYFDQAIFYVFSCELPGFFPFGVCNQVLTFCDGDGTDYRVFRFSAFCS